MRGQRESRLVHRGDSIQFHIIQRERHFAPIEGLFLQAQDEIRSTNTAVDYAVAGHIEGQGRRRTRCSAVIVEKLQQIGSIDVGCGEDTRQRECPTVIAS